MHLFRRFEARLKTSGYLAMSGQIVDATIVAAPKQRNTEAEREAIKAGRIPEGWAEKPAKLHQKDRDARWTVRFSKARPREDGAPQVDIAVPSFSYKNHISIDRRHGLIPGWTCSTRPIRRVRSGRTPIARPSPPCAAWSSMSFPSGPMGLVVRTIGIARARLKSTPGVHS